jgi:SAM-dependent methyltransferase
MTAFVNDLFRSYLEDYFRRITTGTSNFEAAVAWRLSCFDTGARYADYIEENIFSLAGKRILDVASAWGGHAIAFANREATVIASDLNDHRYASFATFLQEQGIHLHPLIANCEKTPYRDDSFDVILALDVVEHIDSIEAFAKEIKRLLHPNGICLLSTPPRIRSFIEGEPHYGLKGLTLLPFRWQRFVSTRLFRRSYPYPITRQYTLAREVIKPFATLGLEGTPILRGRLARKLICFPLLLRLAKQLFWDFLVLTKSGV